jgi:hypothetical protein
MALVEISCIDKPDRHDQFTRIQSVVGLFAGRFWKMTLEEAIQQQEAGLHQFYVNVGGQIVWVRVAQHGLLGHKYLTTAPDDYSANNLLELPECP